MTISSIPSSPTPVNYNYPDQSGQAAQSPPQTQGAAATDSNTNDSSTSQAVQAPLPPGQGTRINQLV